MTERLARLEARLDELAAVVAGLEARLAEHEASAERRTTIDPVAAAASQPGEEDGRVLTTAQAAAGRLPALIGRSCLVLGGAFLVRAITDSGVIAGRAGLAVGLAYALAWLVFAYRSGRAGDTLGAAFHGSMTVLIGFPLLWETTARFGFMGSTTAATAVAGLALACLIVAWRADIRVLAWTGTVATLITVLSLLFATRAVEDFLAVLLVLGAGTAWLAYARHWHVLRWPVAAIADIITLQATLIVSHPGGPRAPYEAVSPMVVAVLAASLFAIYVGSFAVRVLVRLRDINVFEGVQAIAALLIGFGGALQVVRAVGWSQVLPGSAALVLAAACYAVAFAFVERRHGVGRSFFFFGSLALALVLEGARLTLGGAGAAVVWCLLGVASAALGTRFARQTLHVHSAVYLCAAALMSGLAGWAADALLAPAGGHWRPLHVAGVLVLVGVVAGYASLSSATGRAAQTWFSRLPHLVVAGLGAIALGGLLVVGLCAAAVGPSGNVDPGVLAALRSAVLALAAVALAAFGRTSRFAELTWLVYPVLAAGGLKLLVEDVGRGRATTLVPALLCYGVALILVPKLVRDRRD